jgi:hypothetical protein
MHSFGEINAANLSGSEQTNIRVRVQTVTSEEIINSSTTSAKDLSKHVII